MVVKGYPRPLRKTHAEWEQWAEDQRFTDKYGILYTGLQIINETDFSLQDFLCRRTIEVKGKTYKRVRDRNSVVEVRTENP